MFQVLKKLLSATEAGSALMDMIELVHKSLHYDKSRNSERDLPRTAARTGLFKLSQVGATERRGNLFLILCLSYTDAIAETMREALEVHDITLSKFQESLRLYLAMEEWFHSKNDKEEVRSARPLIGRVIELVHEVFPRSDGQGWRLPKTHGLTKMQFYMCLFGNAINFYGGPEETNCKLFVKDTGNNTQGRVDSFSLQCAKRCCETMMFNIAKSSSDARIAKKYEQVKKG